MKTKLITLTADDCYYCLTDFYRRVAKMADIYVLADTCFDCRKICVTKEVQDILWKYYRKAEKMSELEISMIFLNYGPKASLDRKGYFAEFEEGFVVEEGQYD